MYLVRATSNVVDADGSDKLAPSFTVECAKSTSESPQSGTRIAAAHVTILVLDSRDDQDDM